MLGGSVHVDGEYGVLSTHHLAVGLELAVLRRGTLREVRYEDCALSAPPLAVGLDVAVLRWGTLREAPLISRLN